MKLINDLLFEDNEENTILLSWLIKKRLKSNLTLSINFVYISPYYIAALFLLKHIKSLLKLQ